LLLHNTRVETTHVFENGQPDGFWLFWFIPGFKWPNLMSLGVIRYCRVQQKSSPQKFFAGFSATVWNFNLKFYSFIQ